MNESNIAVIVTIATVVRRIDNNYSSSSSATSMTVVAMAVVYVTVPIAIASTIVSVCWIPVAIVAAARKRNVSPRSQI